MSLLNTIISPLQRIAAVLSLIIAISYVPRTNSEPSIYSISDERIRNLDTTPALGRGYSIMTNTFQSTCIMVQETTVPSYTYDCKCQDNRMTTLDSLLLSSCLCVLVRSAVESRNRFFFSNIFRWNALFCEQFYSYHFSFFSKLNLFLEKKNRSIP